MLDKIYIIGESILRKKAKPIKEVGASESKLFDEMLKMMYRENGVGLAANQVGIDKQMCVIDVGGKILKLANPKILKKKGREVFDEGCLSLPGITVKVKRAKVIYCQALNENNALIKFEASELLARAIQHEVDHLLGRLIIDYAPLWKKALLFGKLRALRKKK